MAAALDLRVRPFLQAPRPIPRTLDDIAAIARRSGHRLRARISLPHGQWGEVYFAGDEVMHARVGWALGHRGLVRLRAAEPFADVVLQHHAAPEQLTVCRPWPWLRAELRWAWGGSISRDPRLPSRHR
ncbi:MAG: hypothetical protein KDK70_06575 [Myxococcales bacterium]|nr:hypothetical protein [Myxococcales bacterium]